MELSEIFNNLVSLVLDYRNDDFSKIYREVSINSEINKYLEYTDETREQEGFTGICHVVLSIRVSDKSDFIPFTSAIGSNYNVEANQVARLLLQRHIINYNFVDFVADVVKKVGKDIPRVSFSTEYNGGEIEINETRRFNTKHPRIPWYKPSNFDSNSDSNSEYDSVGENFKSIIPQDKWDDSFVNIISKEYYKVLNLTTLYYTIISLDSNYSNTGRLTHIMIITSDKKEASFFLDRTLERIREIASFIRTRYVSDLLRKAHIEAIKSAKAAIMSRNMSHNLGSHFISNTKNYFSALIECHPDNQKNYRGIKHALQYIQERMDFIATITSTDTYPFGAVNAKAQIFDELTPDDFGNRHGQASYNFLMDYLVLSEKISKQSLGKGNGSLSKLILQIGHWDGKGNPVFWDPTSSSDEDNKKRDQILGINFAIPGGLLGRHAVFSIIENIIRNAAKHGQEKIKGDFIVKLLYRTDEKRLIVFDNKNDCEIKGTVEKMNKKLKEMRFLTPEGALVQESKGLKELLICAIWLQNEDVSQVMTDNDIKNEDDRLENFSKYLKVVAVDENGKELNDNDTVGFLGYSVKLDKYERVHYLKEEELSPEYLQNIKADVVCYKENCEIEGKKLSEIFPRFLLVSSGNDTNDINVLRQVVEKNCGIEAVQRKMVVDYTTDYKDNSKVVSYKNWNQNSDAFLFKGHAGKSKWDKFETLFLTKGFENKYVDAISGGDFTSTLVQPSFVDDEYNLIKIMESVATRFVIIDERTFEHYKPKVTMTSIISKEIKEGLVVLKSKFNTDELWEKEARYIFSEEMAIGNDIYEGHKTELKEFLKDSTLVDSFLKKDLEQHYLERRGIYVFNLESGKESFKMVDLSSNEIEFLWNKDEEKFDCKDIRCDTKTTTFLSVHLGLIDKIKDQLLMDKDNKDKGDTIDKEIVEALKLYFGANFVSIHSGRGGFDIRESLRQYAFQSFSAIENPLYNSKYLLAQQFYTLKYYGTK